MQGFRPIGLHRLPGFRRPCRGLLGAQRFGRFSRSLTPVGPAPLWFPCFGGRVGQGLFLLLFLLLRHLAAVGHGDGVLIVVFSYHEPVFELDPDTGYRVAINGERAIAEDG